jgi:hypothetical protein
MEGKFLQNLSGYQILKKGQVKRLFQGQKYDPYYDIWVSEFQSPEKGHAAVYKQGTTASDK